MATIDDQVRKLESILEQGQITREEFEDLRGKLLAGAPDPDLRPSGPRPAPQPSSGLGFKLVILVGILAAFLFVVVALVVAYLTLGGSGPEAVAEANAAHREQVLAQLAAEDDPLNEAVLVAKQTQLPDMAYVPAGSFLKGRWTNDDRGGTSESVEIRRFVQGYWIDRHEFHGDDRTPLHSVTWNEAQNLCAAQGKSLCTEDQWEKACKGPENRVYPYGDEYAEGTCPPSGLSRSAPYGVGSHEGCVSGYGVYDMAGGCWEWTSSEKDEGKVTKGGYMAGQEAAGTRCAARKDEKSTFAHQNLAFRCCVDDDGTGLAAGETPSQPSLADSLIEVDAEVPGGTLEETWTYAPPPPTASTESASESPAPSESVRGSVGGTMEITFGDVGDAAAMKKYIKRKKGQIRACYEMELKVNPSLAGRVEVVWTVNPDGSVSGVTVDSNTTGSTTLADCIARRIKRWRFPVTEDEFEITYPFNFYPS